MSRFRGLNPGPTVYKTIAPPANRLEPKVGFEPTTYSLQNCCSTTELFRHSATGGQVYHWVILAKEILALPRISKKNAPVNRVHLRRAFASDRQNFFAADKIPC